MSNSIISFAFETQTVRTATNLQNNSIWFCLPDVANVLEISRSSDLLQIQKDFVKNETPSSELLQLEKPAFVKNETSSKRGALDPKGVEKIYISYPSGAKQVTFINEPNLYRVIFRSNKPEAVKFQNWVFDEVLPTLRKTGSYTIAKPSVPAPKPQSPRLSPQDFDIIRRAVQHISIGMRFSGVSTNAIYARLRQMCEVDSVTHLRYEHLPLIQNELYRIERTLSPYKKMRQDTEKALIRRVCAGDELAVSQAILDIEKTAHAYTTENDKHLSATIQIARVGALIGGAI